MLLALLMLFVASPVALARGHCEAHAARAHLSIPVKGLDSWEPVNERTLLVWGIDAARAHLIHLRTGIPNLATVRILTLVDGDHDGLITACGRDAILVTDNGGGLARIRSIEYLSAKRTAELDRQTWSLPLEARLLPAAGARKSTLAVRLRRLVSRAARSADPAPAVDGA
jgi:hypothetical protein